MRPRAGIERGKSMTEAKWRPLFIFLSFSFMPFMVSANSSKGKGGEEVKRHRRVGNLTITDDGVVTNGEKCDKLHPQTHAALLHLEEAGARGLTIEDLSTKLGVKPKSVYVYRSILNRKFSALDASVIVRLTSHKGFELVELPDDYIKFGNVKVYNNNMVFINGHLSTISDAYEFLSALVKANGAAVSDETLKVDPDALHHQARDIRSVFNRFHANVTIKNARGKGYWLESKAPGAERREF
jgi:hypothetical protein